MATIDHKNIPNADLHEPKDASSASINTCYVSNGAGSGTWKQGPHKYCLTLRLNDISNPSTAYAVVPTGGKITKIYSTIDTAITVADATLTFFIGAVPITSSTIVVSYSGSAAGDIDSSTPSAANTVVQGDLVKCTTDGGSTTTSVCTITMEIQVGYS